MDKLQLLTMLGVSNLKDFKLEILESLGILLLMLHWQRGIIDMLVQNNKVKSMTEAEKENWNRVIKNLETYEKFAWEIAPPRALLPIMRHFRITGTLPEGYETLVAKDELGHIPYGNDNLDDIEDILRRVKDCRIFEENNATSIEE